MSSRFGGRSDPHIPHGAAILYFSVVRRTVFESVVSSEK